MRNLIGRWLATPSPSLATLRRHDIAYEASQLVGGLRQARDGRLIVPAWVKPPSIYHFVEDPALLGIITFDPECPDRWELYPEAADVVMLGEVMLKEAIWFSEALPVYRDPLSWVRSGGAGVFPLDWPGFAREMLWHPEVELVIKDVGLGKRIRSELDRAARVPMPLISVELMEMADG